MGLDHTTIAFDLDGTLVDSAPDLLRALNVVIAEHGLGPVDALGMRAWVGHGARAMIVRGFANEEAPLDPNLLPALTERFIAVYAADIASASKPFDGVTACLAELRAAGARLVVCTNKRTSLANALLDALELTTWFDTVIGADMAPRRKPDASHVMAAIAPCPPALAILVGDTSTDVLAARAAGVGAIVLKHGYSPIPVDRLGADAVLDHPGAVFPTAQRMIERRCAPATPR
ncbi:MAG: HAD hydrolase-like protein [Maricaulaceae bacterium]